MGRGKRQKAPTKQGGKVKKVKPDVWNVTKVFKNDAFEAYYTAQNIVEESEREEFMRYCADNLPMAIRINGNRATAPFLLKQIESLRCDDKSNALHPHPLTWFPDNLAWQWNNIDRRTVKKNGEFKVLKQWLVAREQHGAISRQETVSMIPALFLDVQSHHMVLDFCAAPGSKTCQMIERLHRGHAAPALQWVEGAIFANDVDSKRANMLAHQVQRLGSPSVAVVSTDATYFPKLMKNSEQMLFDRILCDVPCTGDGTVRKQPHIWQTWHVKGGFGLHCRQRNILQRGLELLKVGGRLVYSTCSFNPIENEAVVASMIRKYENIKLIEPEDIGLSSKPALTTWRVPKPAASGTEFFESYEDVPEENRKLVIPSMFPQGEEICARRFLPHLMNTGGFFCAIFTKTDSVSLRRKGQTAPEKETPPEKENANANTEKENGETEKGDTITPSAPSRWVDQGSEYAMLTEDSEEWKDIQSFFGLHAWARECIFVNKVGKDKKLYAINKGVQQMLRSEAKTQLKFITAGVRVLQHMDNCGFASRFRLSQEGLEALFAMGLSKRVIRTTSLQFFHTLLMQREVSIEDARKNCTAWEQVSTIDQEGQSRLVSGAAVLLIDGGEFHGLTAALLVTQKTLELYVAKNEASALAESVIQSANLKKLIDDAAVEAKDVVLEDCEEGKEERNAEQEDAAVA